MPHLRSPVGRSNGCVHLSTAFHPQVHMAPTMSFQSVLGKAQEKIKGNEKVIIASAGAATAVLAGAYLYQRSKRSASPALPEGGPFPPETLPEGAYDVVIVGAGPSGAVCAHYLAKGNARVALLEKEKFPRDKYCGDAVCTPAIRILEDMGVLKELMDNNEAHFADAGGLVSPSGISYIGASKEKLGEAACCAVKRINLDVRIAKCAQRSGADLKEQFEVASASFDAATGLWTVTSASGKSVKGRVLVCADGATSKLATKLGYCTEAPRGVCSRAFVEGGTHNTNFDGVCFYPRWSLPGYAAIFRHPNDELNYCYYLIPTASDGTCGYVKESDLKRLHEDAIKYDPFISAALGPNPKMERMKAASLRLGSQGVTTTVDNHLLIIGDAAGHIDPLTGEGIHTAMMGGKAAAQTLLEARAAGNFSSAALKAYERRWMALYGSDFGWSTLFAKAIYRYPIIMDAMASEVQRRGDAFMAKWAEIMTCMQPKTSLFQPLTALQMGVAIARELVEQKLLGKDDAYKLKPKA